MVFEGWDRHGGGLSLRATLILYVVSPLILSLGFSGWLALLSWEKRVEDRLQSDLELVARAIQLPLSYAMERDREGGVQQALESALSLDSVYGAYAYDLEGAPIASASPEGPEAVRGKLTELVSEGKQRGEYGRVGERRVYSYFVPLTDSHNQASGLLQLTRRERDFRRYIARIRRQAMALFVVVSVVTIALVVLGQFRALGRHVERLSTGMRRIAAGESMLRMPLCGPREIVTISDSFNHMLDSMQHAEQEIRRNRRKQLELERQLRHAEKLAAIGQLAAGVAHELGTPLSTISGTVQRELRHEPAGSQRGARFERIGGEAKRMEVIIRQLLDFSHDRELHKRELLPGRVIRSAAAAVAEEAEGRDVKVIATGSTGGPSFQADPVRLEQALVNLLRNGIQAQERGEVRIGWRTEDEQMVFSVDDTGPGIPDSIRPRLFEPFFTTKRVGEGTGLGLAVVHGIVAEHKGTVDVSDSDLGGACVHLRIPMNAATMERQ